MVGSLMKSPPALGRGRGEGVAGRLGECVVRGLRSVCGDGRGGREGGREGRKGREGEAERLGHPLVPTGCQSAEGARLSSAC